MNNNNHRTTIGPSNVAEPFQNIFGCVYDETILIKIFSHNSDSIRCTERGIHWMLARVDSEDVSAPIEYTSTMMRNRTRAGLSDECHQPEVQRLPDTPIRATVWR